MCRRKIEHRLKKLIANHLKKKKKTTNATRSIVIKACKVLNTESFYRNVMFIYVMANAENDRRIDHTYLRDVGGTFFSIKLIEKNLCDT